MTIFFVVAEVEAITGTNPVWVCGHSLGGALAGLAAVDIAQRLGREVRLYTYGAPRFGNRDFIELMYAELRSIHTLYNSGDVVPKLPFGTQGYVRPENKIRFEENGGGFNELHRLGTYAGNILAREIGFGTDPEIDFTDPLVMNYLTQMAPHTFDFFPDNNNLILNVEAFIERERLTVISGTSSKNIPVLS